MVAETGSAALPAPEWSPATRILFRFAFVYFLLYYLPTPFSLIPFVGVLFAPIESFWSMLVPWVGSHFFAVEITDLMPNGSGDRTYGYVRVFCGLVLSLAATLAWTLLDRKRPSYPRLREWLWIFLRFSLGMALIGYGAYKVIKSQFPDPSLDRLLQPFGNASPMGLLWTFMGASDAYTIFGGACEMLGGLLLTFRRTTLLGALVSASVMLNVVMLNFSYDVPVKIYSTHLFLTAVVLALPDLRRMADLFLFNRRVEPVAERPLFERRWLDRSALGLRTAFVVLVTATSLYQSHQTRTMYGDDAPKSPLYGVWTVERIETDGQIRPALITDASRWRRVIFEVPGRMSIQSMDDSRARYSLDPKAGANVLAMSKRDDPKWTSKISYRETSPGVMMLQGTFDGQKIRAVLRKTEADDFLLVNRGFHWINEAPFNR
ncbi:MAG TPA: hypothetical protein VEL74_08565 [Thermoanaerobaculia bacterium]|nr:hypothetical protein [Thermoanaerobaculia bacterium]